MQLVTRAEAKAAGKTRYFTGKICPHGHIAPRQVSSGTCIECRRGRLKHWRKDNKGHVDNYWRKWRSEHPDAAAKILSRSGKKWREANKEHYQAKNREWNSQNSDRLKITSKRWNDANKEKGRESSMKWRNENLEASRSRTRTWQKNNPEAMRANIHARRARKLSAGGRYSKEDVKRILSHQNWKCAAPHCGIDIKSSYQIDHIIPLARDGTNWPSNLQMLCPRCNLSKGAKLMSEWIPSIPTHLRVGGSFC